MTSCLRWLPLWFKVAAQKSLLRNLILRFEHRYHIQGLKHLICLIHLSLYALLPVGFPRHSPVLDGKVLCEMR